MTAPPTFSFLVPTHREDRPLERCLQSIAPQLGRDDEVIVIGDTHDGALPGVEALVGRYDARFRYLAHDAGYHDFGHSQLNYGIAQARGSWLHVNDDDDIWAPGAVNLMRMHADGLGERPLLFRFVSYVGMVFWCDRGRLERNWIGGHCLVAPNLPGKVGQWGPEYNGDFDYIEQTVMAHGGPDSVVWLDPIVAIARPTLAVAAAYGVTAW